MALTPRWVGLVYLAGAAALFGGMYVVSRWALTQVPLLGPMWLRCATALGVLGVYGLATHRRFTLTRSELGLAASIGVVGLGLAGACQLWGTALTGAGWASVTTAAAPVLMAVLARGISSENFSRRRLGLGCAGVGLAVLVLWAPGASAFRWGLVVLLAGAAAWALASVWATHIPSRNRVFGITWGALGVTTLLLAPVAAVTWHPNDTTWSWGLVWAVLYLGGASTAAALVLWHRGVMLAGSAAGATTFFAQPLVGLALGRWFLGEAPSMALLLGAGLLFLAAWWLTRPPAIAEGAAEALKPHCAATPRQGGRS